LVGRVMSVQAEAGSVRSGTDAKRRAARHVQEAREKLTYS